MNTQLASTLQQIDNLKLKLQATRPLDVEALGKIKAAFEMEYTFESNRIEGNTLTLQEAGFVKSDELQTILDNIIETEKRENPYFPSVAPFAGIAKEDESIDEILMAVKYDIKACLLVYYRELKTYKVDVLLQNANFDIKYLFEILKELCTYISENTDKPITAQNKITELLQELDKAPGFNNVLQILILHGVIKWFEVCNINEGDTGYTEAQELCNFVCERLMDVCVFYFMMFKKDVNSQPLDNYLANTDMGRTWVELQNQTNQSNTAQPQQIIIPNNILQALQKKGFIENATNSPLKWIKSKSLLAYFVEVANDKLNLKDSGGRRIVKPFETMFNKTGLQGCINEYKNKTGKKPIGSNDIDKLFQY